MRITRVRSKLNTVLNQIRSHLKNSFSNKTFNIYQYMVQIPKLDRQKLSKNPKNPTLKFQKPQKSQKA